MRRKAVESSNIASVGYKKTEQLLEIRFNTGSVYQYNNVPSEIYEQLQAADSKGSYFSSNIRSSYTYKRIK